MYILIYYINKFRRDKITYSIKLNTIKRLIKLRFAYLQKYTLILNT